MFVSVIVLAATMKNNIKLGRICIPLGIKCNLSCEYCYRDICRKEIPRKATNKFLSYLKSLDTSTYAVIFSGGEPLLYIDTIRKITGILPKHIHKKVMTNGLLLTEELVDYFNNNDFEVHISHDGKHTKELRGQDVFKNKLQLIKKIRYLRIVSVISNQNTNVMKVYQYIQNKLNRPFYFEASPIIPTGENDNLITGFNYDRFEKTLAEVLRIRNKSPFEWYHNKPSGMGLNVLLDGSIVGMGTLNKYGTVWDTEETIRNNFLAKEQKGIAYCQQSICSIKPCSMNKSLACQHMCRINRIRHDINDEV